MLISRRAALASLATGLPILFFTDPRRAFAAAPAPGCGDAGKAQYVILATSGAGDPINCNAPGTYLDPKIVHSADPAMAPTSITMRGRSFTAAAPWAGLGSALDRACFFHLMTDTPIHPKEPQVLSLMGATYASEMFPSILARQLAPCLGTIQTQPLSVGAASPSETIAFGGSPLPTIPPAALRATLVSPGGAIASLQSIRDDAMNRLYALYRDSATPAQRAYVDSLVTSQGQARGIRQDLLASLAAIQDNSPASQVLAAITLIQMNVSPVIAIHVPFGGDNHNDPMLANETAQTVSGVATFASLLAQLAKAGLGDKVSLITLNVFGRTMGPGNTDGRQHNPNHQLSLAIGKPFRGGVIGGVGPAAGDYGALPIDSASGNGVASGGDVTPVDSLASFGKTVLAAVGGDTSAITGGKVIPAALA